MFDGPSVTIAAVSVYVPMSSFSLFAVALAPLAVPERPAPLPGSGDFIDDTRTGTPRREEVSRAAVDNDDCPP